jgi:hypothetical protein
MLLDWMDVFVKSCGYLQYAWEPSGGEWRLHMYLYWISGMFHHQSSKMEIAALGSAMVELDICIQPSSSIYMSRLYWLPCVVSPGYALHSHECLNVGVPEAEGELESVVVYVERVTPALFSLSHTYT